MSGEKEIKFVHYSVMADEVLSLLSPADGETLVDGTLGEAGHSSLVLSRYPGVRLIGLDADEVMIERSRKKLESFEGRCQLVNAWFDEYLAVEGPMVQPEMILLDLGISSFHYQNGRGFSFRADEKLDMRLNSSLKISAWELVNKRRGGDLKKILYDYGEERFSARIVRRIEEARREKPIETTKELADLVWLAYPKEKRHGRIHPATKTFQALRIEVNQELSRLEEGLKAAFKALKKGGRLAVITFHSLEDRIVKRTFRDWAKECRCPPEVPICRCEGRMAELLTRKPIEPSEAEAAENPPSRSARLRGIRKIVD